jgi:hypothetical protein
MVQHSSAMQRRTLLKLGLGATAALAIAGGGIALWQPGWKEGHLSASASDVMRAVANAVLDGVLPTDAAQRARAVDAHLLRLEATISAFAPAVRAELSQLLALLASTPGRLALTGMAATWPAASVDEVQQSLQSMRVSRLLLKQQAYHALRDLTNAAYFSDPSAWVHLGYPGPQDI